MSDIVELSSDDEDCESKKKQAVQPKKDAVKRKLREDGDSDGHSEDILENFEKFLRLCEDVEIKRRKGDRVFITRINDKLMSRFTAADPEYIQSKPFKEALLSATKLVDTDPSNLFVHMKHIGDELKVRSRKDKSRKRKLLECEDERSKKLQKSDDKVENEDNENAVNIRLLHKLEKLFEKVYRRVKHLEEKEVDFDAEEDSSYIKLERYKMRLYKIWERWQDVRGHMDEVKKLIHRKIAFSGTQYSNVNHAIEKFVNKSRGFPDYHDIYKLTDETLNKERSEFNPDQIRGIATAAFQCLGNQLQKMRVYDFWNCCQTYIPSTSLNVDPADEDENLAKALRENEDINEKKMCEVIDKFVNRQIDEKQEPDEVKSESEAESSESSEDEDDPAVIVIISSSSEGSCGEEKSGREHVNGKFSIPANGNVDESSNQSEESNSKGSLDKFDIVKNGKKMKGSMEPSTTKQSSAREEDKPTTSGSSLLSVKLERSNDKDDKDQGNTKSEDRGDSNEVIILSESDSED